MANGKRAGLVKAADLVGAADGPGRSSQKGSVDCGRGGQPSATGWVPAVVRQIRRRQRRPTLTNLPEILAK